MGEFYGGRYLSLLMSRIKTRCKNRYFREQFGINQGFPRYALVNREGILITTAAPRPGDKAAALLIDKYLDNE